MSGLKLNVMADDSIRKQILQLIKDNVRPLIPDALRQLVPEYIQELISKEFQGKKLEDLIRSQITSELPRLAALMVNTIGPEGIGMMVKDRLDSYVDSDLNSRMNKFVLAALNKAKVEIKV